jgi:hypothetical protein
VHPETIVLGRIDPENPIGGKLERLDVEAARTAILENVSRPLGLTVELGAEAILRVANSRMAGARYCRKVWRGGLPLASGRYRGMGSSRWPSRRMQWQSRADHTAPPKSEDAPRLGSGIDSTRVRHPDPHPPMPQHQPSGVPVRLPRPTRAIACASPRRP